MGGLALKLFDALAVFAKSIVLLDELALDSIQGVVLVSKLTGVIFQRLLDLEELLVDGGQVLGNEVETMVNPIEALLDGFQVSVKELLELFDPNPVYRTPRL